MTQRTIYTGLGAIEDVTVDISAGAVEIDDATIELAVGSYTAPGPWQTPNNVTFPTPTTAVASLTIGPGFYNPVATKYGYWLWYQVSVGGRVMIQPTKGQRFFVTDITGISVDPADNFVLRSQQAAALYSGPTQPSPASGEYVWFKTDGNGALLDILSGVV